MKTVEKELRHFCERNQNREWLQDIVDSSEQPKVLRAMGSIVLEEAKKMREEEPSDEENG